MFSWSSFKNDLSSNLVNLKGKIDEFGKVILADEAESNFEESEKSLPIEPSIPSITQKASARFVENGNSHNQVPGDVENNLGDLQKIQVYDTLNKAYTCISALELVLLDNLTQESPSDVIQNFKKYFDTDLEQNQNNLIEIEAVKSELCRLEQVCFHDHFQKNRLIKLVLSWQNYSKTESNKVAALTHNYENLKASFNKLNLDISTILEENKTLKASCDKLQNNNLELEQGIQLINDKYSKLQIEMSNGKQQDQELTEKIAVIERLTRENEEYAKQIAQLKTQTETLPDIKRLQMHLVEVEESYSAQVLDLEGMKTTLEAQVQGLSSELSRSKANLNEGRKNFEQQLSILSKQLEKASKERDDLSSQVISLSTLSETQSKSMVSLQSSLKDIQKDAELQLSILNEAHETKILELKKNYDKMLDLSTKQSNESLAEGYQKQISACDEEIQNYKKKINELTLQLEESTMSDQLNVIIKETEEVKESVSKSIDETLLKNLILAYLRIDPQHKNYVMKVITQLVGISPSDVSAYLDPKPPKSALSWIPGVGRFFEGTAEPDKDSESFSHLFISYLEEESQKALTNNPYLPPVSQEDLEDIINRHESTRSKQND